MKNLLKISCVLAIALFVSMSVNAQLLTPQTTPGTLTVDVPAFMSFSVAPIDNFLVKHANDNNYTEDLTNTSAVDIKSNVKWSFSVKADKENLTGRTDNPDFFPIGKFSYSGFDVINIKLLGYDAIVKNGTKNDNGTLTWTLDKTGLENIFADRYTVGLTYTLAQTGW